MNNRTEPLTIYLTPEEKSQLKEYADEAGKTQSDMGRDAIVEYLDHDRFKRIESELSEVKEMIGSLSKQDTHTHKHDTQMKASETVEKTRSIAQRLQKNNGDSISTSGLERGIKDIAGGDPRTIKKYRNELIERGLCFEHPNDDAPVWYLEKREWLKSLHQYAKQTENYKGTVKKHLEPYPTNWPKVEGKLTDIQAKQ